MYLPIEIRRNIQVINNVIWDLFWGELSSVMFEKDILQHYSPRNLNVPKGGF